MKIKLGYGEGRGETYFVQEVSNQGINVLVGLMVLMLNSFSSL